MTWSVSVWCGTIRFKCNAQSPGPQHRLNPSHLTRINTLPQPRTVWGSSNSKVRNTQAYSLIYKTTWLRNVIIYKRPLAERLHKSINVVQKNPDRLLNILLLIYLFIYFCCVLLSCCSIRLTWGKRREKSCRNKSSPETLQIKFHMWNEMRFGL